VQLQEEIHLADMEYFQLCLHVHMYTHIHIYIYTYIFRYIYTYIHICVYILGGKCANELVADIRLENMENICTNINICMNIYIDTCIHVSIYLYTLSKKKA